jgi:two-component system chemotaxis response regulator CheY
VKILLVDDSKTMRNIQKRTLATLPEAEFIEAADGVEGLAAITSAGPNGFQLVLVDWNMPNMDGLTFVQQVRKVDKTTPMIMCTTEAEKSRVIDALKAGVNNYVIKPFTPEGLTEKVQQTLQKVKAA